MIQGNYIQFSETLELDSQFSLKNLKGHSPTSPLDQIQFAYSLGTS